jgi:hypothetical protein
VNPVEPAWIDNLTAITRLPLLSSEEDLRLLLSGQGPAGEHLMTILHETAHHQCFRQGPVGPLPAYLECLAASSAYLTATGDEPEEHRIATIGYVTLSRGATEILRPLSEGLALFSEFDTVSGPHSDVTSLPYTAATNLFVNALGSGFTRDFLAGRISSAEFQRRSEIAMFKLVAAERTDDRAVGRKASLLLQPVNPSVAGGYLAGYLAVKRLYLRCVFAHAPLLLTEPDLFLFYVTQYVYGDPVLAAALIDATVNLADALEAFVVRLAERLWNLPNVLTNDSLAELQRATLGNDPSGMKRAIGITEEEDEESAPVLSRFTSSLEAADADSENPLGPLVRALVFQRKYLYLGELRADVRFEEGYARVEVPGATHGLRLPVFRTRQPGDADTVHLISPVQDNGKWSVAAVYEKGGEVLGVSWGRWYLDDQEELTDALLDERLSVATTRARVEDCQDSIARALGDDQYLAELRGWLRSFIHGLYLPLAFDPEPASSFAEIEARMDWGLLGLLPKRALVRRFARLGLANSVARSYDGLSIVFDKLGWGPLDDEVNSLVDVARDPPLLVTAFSTLDGQRYLLTSP